MGYSYEAPENTLPSYRLAKEKGFYYVECDVTYTSDGVPVLHHLETIDSTSNGTGKVTQMTYNQLLEYDFGSWKNSKYVGTKIPTFEEFIALCAQLGLHPYIELKDHGNHTRESLGELVAIVEKYGMLRQCTWITFIHDYFFYINEFDPQARVGLLWPFDVDSRIITKAASIKTSKNKVFLNVNYDTLTDSGIQRAKSNGFPVEVYTVDDENTILNANSYISGFTSNYVVAQSVIGEPDATGTTPITYGEDTQPTPVMTLVIHIGIIILALLTIITIVTVFAKRAGLKLKNLRTVFKMPLMVVAIIITVILLILLLLLLIKLLS
jgi:glycerophosphoryl diester phosphodiesterase